VKGNWAVVITAILCITALELYAMHQQVDGYLFSLAVIVVAGLAGFKVRDIKFFWRK